MEDLGFVPENPVEKPEEKQVADTEPMTLTITIKPTWADIRYNIHAMTDALVIAPRADRKLAKNVISVIKNATKIERRHELEAKKTAMPTHIYDVDDLRLEIEHKPDNENKHNYIQPRIITIINRKTKKIMDRVTKPFLVARINSAVLEKEQQIEKAAKALEQARKGFQKIYENQTQK